MKKGSVVFAVVLFLIVGALLIPTFAYPPKSRLFPLIALFTILCLLVIQIIREVSDLKGVSRQAVKREGAIDLPSKHAAIWAWLAGTLIMLWIFGFMGTVFLLPFLYFRSHKEGWLVSITLPLGCGVFFYTLFGWALGMPLYPGMLFSRFFE